MKMKIICMLMLFCIFTYRVAAQAGNIDTSFNSLDIGFGYGDGATSNVLCTSVQTDNKIIIGGSFQVYNSVPRNGIARLNSDGSLDSSFDPGTGVSGNVISSVVQNDGKVIIAGDFTSVNGVSKNGIARLNSDGTLDMSFNGGTVLSDIVLSVTLQVDGKIIIVGSFNTIHGASRNYIARLNSNGSLDSSFNPGGGASNYVYSATLQIDGKIIIGGQFTSYNGISRNYIARINADGSLDTSFSPGTGANNIVRSTPVQSDGKIIICGYFTSVNGVQQNYIARLNSNGSLDSTFTSGTGANNFVRTAILLSNGKIIIGGQFTSYNGFTSNFFTRLNVNGTIDTSFNSGAGSNNFVRSSTLQSDGRILISGDFTTTNGKATNFVTRLNTDGSLDVSFNQGNGANSHVLSSLIQSDGKIVIGGGFTGYNGVARNRIARLRDDGILDTLFNPGTGFDNGVWATAIQNDQKIIAGGSFTSFNGSTINRVARLNIDGSLDTTFNPGTGVNNTVWAIALQNDGKIILGGGFTSINGTNVNRISRLNSDGSLDLSFNPTLGPNGTIYSILIQNDGKIVIVGGGLSLNTGLNRYHVMRLNSDGSLDGTFNSGEGASNSIYSVALQIDGKIIIGGGFTTYNNAPQNYIARLNSDGSIDATFNSGSGADFILRAIAIQNNGRIVIGGYFNTYNGITKNRIARLNSDGTLDTTFISGTGRNGDVIYSTILQPDGKIIIGGDFTSYNGTGRNRLARINGDCTSSTQPIINLAITPGSQNICSGASVTFTATTSNAGLSPNYRFIINNSIVQNGANATYTSTTFSNNDTITCEVTSSDPCSSPQITTSNSIILVVNQPTTSFDTISSCELYVWPVNNQTYTSSGTYTYVGTNASGCSHTSTLNLTLFHNILASNDTTICSGQSITISAGNVIGTQQQICSSNDLPSNLRTGLVAYYPFCGNAYDATMNGNNGAINGATLSLGQQSVPNTAFNFNGINNTIDFQNPFLGGGQVSTFTFHTKLKLNSTSNSPNIWGKTMFWGEVNFFITNDNRIGFSWANSITGNKYSQVLSIPNTVQVGVWHDIVILFNNSILQIYCDGNLIPSAMVWSAQGGSIISTSQVETQCNFAQDVGSSKIGLRITGGSPGNYFNGVIDEFSIWNRALTLPEIQQLYQSSSVAYSWSTGATTQNISVAPTQTTTYYLTISSSTFSCTDSVTITVNNPTSSSSTIAACDGYTWNNQTYTQSGTYSYNTINTVGCDSVATLNLTINQSTTSSDTIISCDPYLWPLDGNVYSSSGTYVNIGLNDSNCIHSSYLILDVHNSWKPKANINSGRGYATTFTIGNKGYMGLGQFNNSLTDFWEYDPRTDTWTQKADFMGSPRFGASGFAIDGKGYICNGLDGQTFYNDLWMYDPQTNVWVQKSNFGGSPRFFSVAFSIGHKGYVGTGGDFGVNYFGSSDFWEYDPSIDSWTQISDFAGNPTYAGVAFSISNKGYVGMGYGPSQYSNEFWEYDPSFDSWTQKADCGNLGKYTAVGFSIGDKGYIGTGSVDDPFVSNSNTNDFWEYDINNDSWIPINDFHGGLRSGAFSFSIGNKGYIGSGANGYSTPNDFWEFQPTTFPIITDLVDDTICAGAMMDIPFSIGCIEFSSGNLFNAQLSDEFGSFANAISIGVLSSTISANINSIIPSGLVAGNQYRVRVTSTSPSIIGLDNGIDIVINPSTSLSDTVVACNDFTWIVDGNTYTSSGYYTHTSTNNSGCPHISTLNLTINSLNVSAIPVTPIQCFSETASVVVSASGGTAPYTGTGTFNQGSGTFVYNVSDNNGCSGSDTISLSEPTKLEGTIITTPANCGFTNGYATVNATGGTGSYSYMWSNGQTTATATALSGGTYTVTITDANGCTGTATAVVGGVGVQPDPAGLIIGPTGACRNTCGVVYSVPPVSGATSYTWVLPSGVTGTSSTNSISLCFSNTYSGGFLCVTPSNSCGSSAQSCINIPVIPVRPSQPGFIVGNPNPCGPNIFTYSIPLVNNALSYNWSVSGSGVAILSGQGTNSVSVSIPVGFGQGTILVNASNCVGTTSTRTLVLTGIPTHSNVLNGPSYVCANSNNVLYSINPVNGTSSYAWTTSGDISIGSSSGPSGVVNFGPSFTSGTINVTTSSGCGEFTRTYTIRSVPIQPGNIYGPGTNLCGQSGVTYSLDPVASATSYNWTVPAGASITSNTGTSITVNFGPSFTGSGNICVSAINVCGSSTTRCYNVTAVPAVPSSITGPASVCKSSANVTYTVSPVAGTTYYSWYTTGNVNILPSGIGLSADANFSFSTTYSTVITTRANNNCGISQPFNKTVSIDLNCREANVDLTKNAFNIYPNPTDVKITLEFTQTNEETCILQVVDLLGTIVLHKRVNAVEGLNAFELDLESLSRGMYFVVLERDGGKKLMVRVGVE